MWCIEESGILSPLTQSMDGGRTQDTESMTDKTDSGSKIAVVPAVTLEERKEGL